MATANVSGVLSAAARLFRARGFERATVRDIAKAAGMLAGSLHYRYRTKEKLLLELMRRAVDVASREVQTAAAGAPDPVEALRRALKAHMRVLLHTDDSMFVLLNEWRTLRGKARSEMIRLRDSYEALWTTMLDEAVGTGRIRPGVDMKLVRLLGLGAANSAGHWYSEKGRYDSDEIADALFALMAQGALGEKPLDAAGLEPEAVKRSDGLG